MNWYYIVAAMNVITFIMFAWDMFMSVRKGWRIPESTLLVLSALMGSFGAFAGMYLFHHKTQKLKFSIPVPLMMVAQTIIILTFL